MYILQMLINGLCQGSIYALMAIGYTVNFGVVGLVSFSYGETVMVGAYGAFYTFALTGNFLLSLLIGFFCGGFLGLVQYIVCVQKFLKSPRVISMVCTVAFSILIRTLAQNVFGEETKAMGTVFRIESYQFGGGLYITNIQLIVMAVVILSSVALTLFLNKTRVGTMLRAVSQDRKAASLVGINVKRTTMLGNSLGSALGGIAGVLTGVYYATIVPTMGSTGGLKSIISCVLGGQTNILGAALSAVGIGVLENVGIMWINTGLRDIISFIFLVVVLILSPRGLFVRRGGKKA